MQPSIPSANWTCSGVCGQVAWLGHNTTVCCVETCKYDLEIHPWIVLTRMFVNSHSRQHLLHLVGSLGVCPGRGRPRLPPHPGSAECGQGPGPPLPVWVPAPACLARLLLLEEGKPRTVSPHPPGIEKTFVPYRRSPPPTLW